MASRANWSALPALALMLTIAIKLANQVWARGAHFICANI